MMTKHVRSISQRWWAILLRRTQSSAASLSEKQSETLANSLAGGQKAKRPNEFICNNELKLEFEFKFKLVSWWTSEKRPNEFKCNNKL